jgi:putative NADH-flavin reductase
MKLANIACHEIVLKRSSIASEQRTMKLVVLGATGGTGLEIVQRGLEQGHRVTAFVRSPDRLKVFQGRISIKQGDLLSSSELEQAIESQDAVVSTFGPRVPRSKADANLLQHFAVALARAMLHAGVRRLVVESVAFLFRDSIMPPTYLFGRLFFPDVVADSSAMERVLQESTLDWTIIRPPQLTDKPFTGKYRVRESHLPYFGFTISRADVADFMIKTVEDRSLIHKIVGISN